MHRSRCVPVSPCSPWSPAPLWHVWRATGQLPAGSESQRGGMPALEIVTAAVTHGNKTWKVNVQGFALSVVMGQAPWDTGSWLPVVSTWSSSWWKTLLSIAPSLLRSRALQGAAGSWA